ncbi:MAG: septation protein A [Gammaproteobacteria bacterium]
MKFLFDFFPILLFFLAYKLKGIYFATGVAIAAAFVQTFIYWLKHRRFENMHLITLGLLTVFGGLTLALHDPVFIKWKPTIINWLFAGSFLASQLFAKKTLVERMMSEAIQVEKPIWAKLNIAWILFFIAMGAVNLYVAFNYPENTWVNFKLFGMMGMTLVFVFAQALYLSRYMTEDDEISPDQSKGE